MQPGPNGPAAGLALAELAAGAAAKGPAVAGAAAAGPAAAGAREDGGSEWPPGGATVPWMRPCASSRSPAGGGGDALLPPLRKGRRKDGMLPAAGPLTSRVSPPTRTKLSSRICRMPQSIARRSPSGLTTSSSSSATLCRRTSHAIGQATSRPSALAAPLATAPVSQLCPAPPPPSPPPPMPPPMPPPVVLGGAPGASQR
mmetsp:Transcript_32831/g.103082  ORF Transcript_32831/g.103082 Transcript_32831/m.103082 type:complete len:200 (+) Transcript_32831:759-1358(+)